MIVAEGLKFRYKRRRPLFEGLDFKLPVGSIVGLLGRNGEGKSTLMKLLCGHLVPDSGVLLHQDSLVSLRQTHTLQRVYMLAEDVQTPRVSVKEYFEMVAPFYPTFDGEIAKEIVDAFEIDWSWKMSQISLGQRKKSLIALALALRTPLLLLDEPTNGLDIPSKSLFRRLLAKYSGENQTILISTHQVRDLEQLIDHIMLLDGNKLVCNASIAELTSRLRFAPIISKESREHALYHEAIFGGEYGIWERSDSDETEDFSMELFFNAMIASRERMHRAIGVQSKN